MAVLFTGSALCQTFNDRGVITIIDGVSMAAGGIATFGVIDVSDREAELCIMVHGSTPDDSLNATVEILGMMSPNLADTLKSIQVLSSTSLTAGGAVTFADTLDGDELVPYLYPRITNADADSTATLYAWLYMKQKNVNTFMQR